MSRDPLGESGGISAYSLLENAPGDSWDFLGLADGHHIVPQRLWHLFSKEVKAVWNSARGRIPTSLVRGEWHDMTAHGEYTARVEHLLMEYVESLSGKCRCFGAAQADEFLSILKHSDDPYVKGFLGIVGKAKTAVKAWYASTGKALKIKRRRALKAVTRAASTQGRSGASRVLGKGRGVLKGVKIAFYVVAVGEFIYYYSEGGTVLYALEETVKSQLFINEINTGNRGTGFSWLTFGWVQGTVAG